MVARRTLYLCLALLGACSDAPQVPTVDLPVEPQAVCEPGEVRCEANVAAGCNDAGQWVEVECGSQICVAGACGECPKGKLLCAGAAEDEIWRCPIEEGEQPDLQEVCDPTLECKLGFCLNPCSPDVKANSSVGCEYFAVDLENSDQVGAGGSATAEDAQFAVILSNPDDRADLSVEVFERPGGERVGDPWALAPGELVVAKLPAKSLRGTSLGPDAYYLKGSRPFLAYQFNPLDNAAKVFSNDASLLLPASAAGKEFIALNGFLGSFLTVVGLEDGTSVTVVPTVSTAAGGAVPIGEAGKSLTVEVDAGEVLNLRALELDGDDLSGSVVASDKPVFAFSGNEATPTSSKCCADHLEQQLIPVPKWGRTVVAARSAPRGLAPDYWRIVAAEDATEVSFDPPVSAPVTLDRGQPLTLEATESFVISATGPVLVMQILASSFEALAHGERCNDALPCPEGRVCLGAQGNGSGVCYERCTFSKDSCPAAADACYHQFGAMPADSPNNAKGLCTDKFCDEGSGGCPTGTSCAHGFYSIGTAGCVEQCSSATDCTDESGAWCADWNSLSICVSKTCQTQGDCPSGSYCHDFGSYSECRFACNPVSTCEDAGYHCFRSVADGVSVCRSPNCKVDADCPSGHGCADGFCQPIGDPAMIMAVPVGQFRTNYVFLAPIGFRYDYVNVFGPAGAEVHLDGEPIAEDDFTPITSEWKVARLLVTDGVHTILGSEPVGVTVYGFDDDVSYGYPAGMDLNDL